MTAGRMNVLAWVAEILGLIIVILGVASVLPERFLAAGLLLMVVGILAKFRVKKMGRQG